ncbi:TerB family tellurite resistance protein [Thermodesulfobacteriota bacterium]
MVELIKRFINRLTGEKNAGYEEENTHDIKIATCALFLEMAMIDGEFSDSERESILTILKEEYQLPDEAAHELLEKAGEELKGQIDFWRFASLINRNYSIDEKIGIIEMIWKIAYTDGNLDKHEDYLIHKLAGLLRLSHDQLIEAKLKIINAGSNEKVN